MDLRIFCVASHIFCAARVQERQLFKKYFLKPLFCPCGPYSRAPFIGASTVFGRQYLNPEEDEWRKPGDIYDINNSTLIYYLKGPYNAHTPDFYLPIFTLVEFLCYMGWIKVAANLLNPFGDDDEDFKINYLIDRNLQVKG